MSFCKPQSKLKLFWLCLPIAVVLALLAISRSFSADMAWDRLNEAMATKEQLFVDHAWRAGTAPPTAEYVGTYETFFPQGYWHLKTDKRVAAPEIHQTIRKHVKKGTPVTFLFYSTADYQKKAQLRFSLRKNKAPYTTYWTQVATLTDTTWGRHFTKFSFACPEIAPDEVNFSVALEPPTKRAEFGSTFFFITGDNDPTFQKPLLKEQDRAQIDAERVLKDDQVDQRIDRIRKRKLVIAVQDQNGKPLPGVAVKVKMLRHAFPFGCTLSQSQVTDPQFQQSKLAKAIFSTFNTVFLELDWATVEKSKGNFDFEALDKSIDFLKQNNMSVFATLWRPGQKPPDWLATSKATAGGAIRGYVSHVVSHLTSKVEGFNFSLDQPGMIGEWVDHTTPRLTAEKLMAWLQVAAPVTKPNFILRVDDPSKMQHVIDAIARDGPLPNGLSLSMPIVSSNFHDVDEWLILDSLKRLNTGIYIKGWVQTTKKTGPIDEHEAATLKRLYTALFSNPLVKAIIFPEPIDAASLLVANGTTTPLNKDLNFLLQEEWRSTRDGFSDSTGKMPTKLFFGNYEISANDKKGHSVKTEVNFFADQPMPQEVTLTIKSN